MIETKIRMIKIIKLLLFQITLYELSTSSSIRYISLPTAAETIEILLNQSYEEIGSLNCTYNSFYSPSVNILIEHLNSYFIPKEKEYNIFNSSIIYKNVNVDFYLNFIFQFQNNILINQKLFFLFFFNEISFIQSNDNTFSAEYKLNSTYIDYCNMKEYSIINEIIQKCDRIKKLIKYSIDKIFKQLFKIYPRSDNEFIMDKMILYFEKMTFTSYNYTYKGRISSCVYDSYERINDKNGVFISVDLNLEFGYNNIMKDYKIHIKEIELNSDTFRFIELKVDEYNQEIENLIKIIFDKVYNTIIKKLSNN